MTLSGQWLFAAAVSPSNTPELVVLDASNPASPTPVATLPLPGLPIKLFVSGTQLYAAADKNGLLVNDFIQPASPTLLTQWQPATYVEDVVVQGNLALIAADQVG